jgi:hypothetical protein
MITGGPRLVLRHADTAQRWIDEQSVCWDAIAYAPRIAVEQVRRDDLEIVVGCICSETVAVMT